jgi:phosphoglycolate phosphatase-like HAD superfamily hydrolase
MYTAPITITGVAMYKNFIWDYDGTLFDTYPAITRTYQEVLKKYFSAESNYHEIYALAKISLIVCNENLAAKYKLNLEELHTRFTEDYAVIPVNSEPPFPGACEILDSIQTTGGQNFLITHRDETSLLRSLEYFNMKGVFADIVTRDQNFPKKPDPGAFHYLLDKHRLHPVTTIGIGDREIDIQAAKGAGIRGCYIHPDGLKLSIADYNVKNLIELKRHILEI